jgi:hypothetical protein
MESEKQNNTQNIEAETFTGMHLSETGIVDDFIHKLKSEIGGWETVKKNEYLHAVIRKVNKESASHNHLCSLENCTVKEYFKECLLKLEVLCELRRLN